MSTKELSILMPPDGVDPKTGEVAKPNIGRSAGTGPITYKGDPALVRSKIYSTLGVGIPSIHDLRRELDSYNAVFMCRMPLPDINGITDLLEFATAVMSRLREVEGLLERAENDITPGHGRGSPMHQFRTRELRAAIEIAKAQMELGSRRLTYAVHVENMNARA